MFGAGSGGSLGAALVACLRVDLVATMGTGFGADSGVCLLKLTIMG